MSFANTPYLTAQFVLSLCIYLARLPPFLSCEGFISGSFPQRGQIFVRPPTKSSLSTCFANVSRCSPSPPNISCDSADIRNHVPTNGGPPPERSVVYFMHKRATQLTQEDEHKMTAAAAAADHQTTTTKCREEARKGRSNRKGWWHSFAQIHGEPTKLSKHAKHGRITAYIRSTILQKVRNIFPTTSRAGHDTRHPTRTREMGGGGERTRERG